MTQEPPPDGSKEGLPSGAAVWNLRALSWFLLQTAANCSTIASFSSWQNF